MSAVAAVTAAASRSNPATGTTSALRPSRRTAGPNIAVAAGSVALGEAGVHVGWFGLTEESEGDMPVRGRHPTHPGLVGPGQRTQLFDDVSQAATRRGTVAPSHERCTRSHRSELASETTMSA